MSENKSKKGTPAASDWSDEEKAATKERAKELRDEKSNRSKASDEQAVMDKIDEMPEAERLIPLRLHKMIKQEFPDLFVKKPGMECLLTSLVERPWSFSRARTSLAHATAL